MSEYLFIESREPGETFGDGEFTDWVKGLTGLGHSATVVLTQNAVIAARPGCIYNANLKALQDGGVTVLADGFYATEKSIAALADGVGSIDMDALVDRIMTDGVKTIWH